MYRLFGVHGSTSATQDARGECGETQTHRKPEKKKRACCESLVKDKFGRVEEFMCLLICLLFVRCRIASTRYAARTSARNKRR